MMLFSLAPICVQGQGKEAAANSSLPRVSAVNGRIEVGQMITVDVNHLSDWSINHDPQKLVPYLNGKALARIYPEQLNLSENRLLFHLRRTPESRKEWENLLHEPVLRRPISFSVGLEQQPPFDTVFDYDHRLTLIVISKTWGIVSLAVSFGMLALLVFLSIRTNILRQAGPSPSSGKFRPYDLGRVQTAFWFFIVTTSYFCVWLITGDLDTLAPSILGLIGISAGTTLGPHLRGALENDLAQPVAAIQLSTNGVPSKGVLRDIISDANGYSFPRFQMVLWTILMGSIFVSSVYDNLAMPKFSGSLVALMGISAGTYFGFEVFGKRSAVDDLRIGREVLR